MPNEETIAVSLAGHPSLQLHVDDVLAIREHASAAEAAGQLVAEQTMLVYKRSWFNLYNSHEWGGLGLSLPEALRLLEGIAWADGSTGWVVTLCSGASLFAGYLDPALRRSVFSSSHLCIAGSGKANGTAAVVEGGYKVNGHWPYASGARHATHFTANCHIIRDGEQMKDADGSPIVQSFLFMRDEVRLFENWHYIGMRATGGDAFSVEGLIVPLNRTFIIAPTHVTLPGIVYQYPFQQFAEATLAINSSGMSIRFLELLAASLHGKTMHNSFATLHRQAVAELDKYRTDFFAAVEQSWLSLESTRTVDKEALNAVTKCSRRLASKAREWVDKLFPYGGLRAAMPGSAMHRVWCDIHTASQHSLLIE